MSQFCSHNPFRSLRFLCLVPLLLTSGTSTSGGTEPAQEEEVLNPYIGDADSIEQGKAFFRLGCALCHSIDARGSSRGPDLTAGHWNRGGTDAAILRTITDGIPGTEMPGSFFSKEENQMIVAWLRSQEVQADSPAKGDAESGKRIFFEGSDCSVCHMVNGEGGRLGPDLSRIGASRSADHLIASIRRADEEITKGFERVIVTTKEGRRIDGAIKNEDTFSIQIMSDSEELHFFLKKELAGIERPGDPLMLSYGSSELSEEQLNDLVAYLDSLRGE